MVVSAVGISRYLHVAQILFILTARHPTVMKIIWIAYNRHIDVGEGELVLVLSKEEVNRLVSGEEVYTAGIMVKEPRNKG